MHIARTAILATTILIGAISDLQAQATLAEKLGYDAAAKLLVVHADDIGLARSVNVAAAEAFEKGAITSGSVMVPCPWFADFAAYYREHGPFDVGIHVALTSEWETYRWGGVSPPSEIPSLLDKDGYLYRTVEEVAQHAEPAEVEKEIRAQIERAMSLGVTPTHLDTHMASVLATPELARTYIRLGQEYGIPVLTLPKNWMPLTTQEIRDVVAVEPVLDGVLMVYANDPAKTWEEIYAGLIASVRPGLNQLIVHLALDDTEMQGITVNHPDFGSAWRQRDLDFVTSEAFHNLLEAHDITLVTWTQIGEAMRSR